MEPLRQRFQNFGPTGTLASKISEFWTYWNPCVKDFRILDLLESIIGFNKSFLQWAGIEVKNKKLMPICR